MDYKETDFSFLYCQSYSWKLDIQVKPLESQTHRCRVDELVGNLTAHRLCLSER